MTKRIREICSALPRVSVFADVGCDHGYCTRYMFERGLCERAYVTDIGKKCLQKAESLLAAEIAAGKCVPVCCDGLSGVPQARAASPAIAAAVLRNVRFTDFIESRFIR